MSIETLTHMMEPVARVLELFGVAVIVTSVVYATIKFATDLNGQSRKAAYDVYRANLGRGILLGLELLVGSDIISTITAPLTWESVGLLGVIVLIRTFLSFSLETEIEGAWPWQRRQREEKASR